MGISTISTDLKPFNTTISYKQASLGVLWAVTFGYGIYLLTYFLDPILVSMFNWSLISFSSNLYLFRISPPNHLYFVLLGFSFLTDIPACFGWFFGGIILGSYYKRKNAHFNGVNGSWKSFQLVIMAIELVFIGSAFYYIISYSFGINNMSISLFFGGLLLILFTLFITAGFWLSLSFVLMGGIIGSKFTKSIGVPPPVKKVPKIVKGAETKPVVAKPAAAKPAAAKARAVKTVPSIKVEKAEVSVEIPTKPPVVEKVEITEAEIEITEEVLNTGMCPKCKILFPAERLKMIQKGNDTFCPKCLYVVKAFEIRRKRNKIKEIFRVGVELISEDKEKAKSFFEDALDLAEQIKDDELINEIEEIIRKIE